MMTLKPTTTLKPTVEHGVLIGSPATAAYIADLMFQHRNIDAHMQSSSGHGAWFVFFGLVLNRVQVINGSAVPSGSAKFDFGIYNITLMHRFMIGARGPTIEKLSHPNRMSEDDRKAWNTFLDQLSQELRKLYDSGRRPAAANANPVLAVDAPAQPGRVRLKLRTSEEV